MLLLTNAFSIDTASSFAGPLRRLPGGDKRLRISCDRQRFKNLEPAPTRRSAHGIARRGFPFNLDERQ